MNRLHAGLSFSGRLLTDDELAFGLMERSDGAFDGEGDGLANSRLSIVPHFSETESAACQLERATQKRQQHSELLLF